MTSNDPFGSQADLASFPFEPDAYNPFASPLRPDVADFLRRITAVQPVVAATASVEDTLYQTLQPEAVHKISIYCFLQCLGGSVASASNLLGNYVWVDEDDYGPRCILWAAPEGFFVRGIPASLRPEVEQLLGLKIRTAWQVG